MQSLMAGEEGRGLGGAVGGWKCTKEAKDSEEGSEIGGPMGGNGKPRIMRMLMGSSAEAGPQGAVSEGGRRQGRGMAGRASQPCNGTREGIIATR